MFSKKDKNMIKRTKIVATVSDQRCDKEFIQKLFESGMNVVRINTAHVTFEGMDRLIDNVRSVSNKIAIMMDTKGPEIRTTICDNPIVYKIGDKVKMIGDITQKTVHDTIFVSYPNFVRDIKIGSDVLIDDGDLSLKVLDKTANELLCEVQNDSILGARKSVNIPGAKIDLPSLTEKDINNIKYAIKKNIDFIAHSFVRNAHDIQIIKDILDKEESSIRIIAKIENQQGVDNIEEILEVGDGVMIARGDLGIEIPQENIPGIQRKLIKKCRIAKKPVIVATQMLHTMISNPRPTRAEVTDIANAIYSNTDALMLSGETAYGKYPVEAVKTMATIANQAEVDTFGDDFEDLPYSKHIDVTEYLSKQAVKSTFRLNIKAIITDSHSGRTARNLSAFRSKYPILAICYNEKTMRHLALSYGVHAIYMPSLDNGQEYYFVGLKELVRQKEINESDMVAYLSSGKAGTHTSFLEINLVKDVLQHVEELTLPNKDRYL